MKEISSKKMKGLNESSKKELNIKDILEKDNFELELDDDEYLKIKEELINYKQKQEKDVELLEKELNQLKEENAKNEKLDVNDNIIIDENLQNKLKEEIISQILPKIDEEFQKKKSEIDDKLKEMDKDNRILIDNNFKDLINSLKKNDINQNIKEDNIEQKKKTEHHNKKVLIKLNKNEKHSNKENNIRTKNNKDEENENDNSFLKNKNYIKSNNSNFGDINKNKEGPYKIIQNEDNNMNNMNHLNNSNLKNKTQVIQRKKTIDNLFELFNGIFFKNEHQTSINGDKISENTKKNLKSKYNKYKREFKEKDLTTYFDVFVRRNVLRIFERSNNPQTLVDNLKYNIETILSCFELDKYLYKIYYYPQNNNKQIDHRERKKSTEAAIKFRKVFNVDESIINENELIRKLGNYDNDIYKVFQVIYG